MSGPHDPLAAKERKRLRRHSTTMWCPCWRPGAIRRIGSHSIACAAASPAMRAVSATAGRSDVPDRQTPPFHRSRCEVARRPVSRPAAARISDPVQTDVVQVLVVSAARTAHLLVSTQATGRQHEVHPGTSLSAVSATRETLPWSLNQPGSAGRRTPSQGWGKQPQHLVWADRVQRGEPWVNEGLRTARHVLLSRRSTHI